LSLFNELKRRNVFKVTIAYIVVAWLAAQVMQLIFESFGTPDWVMKTVLVLMAAGLVFAIFFSWAFEMTPDGIKREHDVDRSKSITPQTGKKLNYLIFAVMAIAIIYFAYDKFILSVGRDAALVEGTELAMSEQPATEEVPAQSDQSIAVLPFVNMSDDPENEYFADGLTEELLNRLAQAPGLEVAGRTSSFSYKGHNEDLRVIGATLGVANILEGSVRKQGRQLRVTAQLIRAEDGFHLWSNTYDRALDDVFAIQDDIAESVTRELKIILDEDARNKMRQAGIRNVDAFVAYQKGNELFGLAHGTESMMPTLRRGVIFFEQAIELVPEFGAAYWAMTDYYGHVLEDESSSQEELFSALFELRQVLDAAYQFSEDSSRKAFIDVDRVIFSDDWTPLKDRIEKALATTACPDANWIELAEAMGYAEQMNAMWKRYMRCDPLDFYGPLEVANSALWSGDAAGSIAVLEAAEGVLGQHSWFSGVKRLALLALGRADEALALAPEVTSDPESRLGVEALPHAAAGRLELSRESMQRWIAKHGSYKRLEIPVLAALGDRQSANAAAAEIDARPGGPMLLMRTVDICFCGAPFDLSATPNFQVRVEQAGIPWPPATRIHYPAKDW